ncbi:MAG: hypothetical protein ACRD19_07760 [Terriglobia bacterium]
MGDDTEIPFSELVEVNPHVDLRGLHDEAQVSFIPMSDVSDSGRWLGRQERCLADVRVGYTSFAEGDLLFAKITPCMENGKGALASSLVNGIGFGSTEFHVLRARDGTDPRFIFHWLQSTQLRRRALAFMGGSAGQQRVQEDFFDHFRIPRTDPIEQTRIAAVLDLIDGAIAKTEAVIAKLKQVREGLLHDLLTRGIDENGELRDPVAHPERFQKTALGQVPAEWVCEQLGPRLRRAGGFIQTGPFGSQLHASEYTPEGVPVVMPQDIVDGRIVPNQIARIPDAGAKDLKRHYLALGDLLFARRGELSKCACVSSCQGGWLCGTGCLLLRAGGAAIRGEWLSLMYRHSVGQRQIAALAVGTTMVNLNTSTLERLNFGFPGEAEQAEIATRVSSADGAVDEELRVHEKLARLKSGLRADLLTGRVRVPESVFAAEAPA